LAAEIPPDVVAAPTEKAAMGLAAVVQTGKLLWLVIFALLCAAVSVYYYFRVIQAMYFKDGDAQTSEITPGFKALLVITAIIVILLGIFPQWLIDRLYDTYMGV
jgi:NADH-quinone oxidoreductase subunit N